tara:strand:- start:55 stop:198 length:144 start_codon:yes stop_codon:yes gene_type:complete
MTNENTPETDTEILISLYMGNHLNSLELERAKQILFILNGALKSRIK